MLPKILDIAEEQGLVFDPRTYGKKETLAKCPFCYEDANKPRYYLSLNTIDQVYKCWFCKVRGGVLDFESRLSGVPYPEVKEKYFGKSKRTVHPAELLNSNQLDRIGCNIARSDRQLFKEQREFIYQQWLAYEHYQLSELFAELVLIASVLKDDLQRQYGLLDYLKKRCEKSCIRSCYERLTDEYKKNNEDYAQWAKDGLAIARIAWKAAHAQADSEFSKLVLQVPFIHSLYMKEKENLKSKQSGNSIAK